MPAPPPPSTLFPYTTLFRSAAVRRVQVPRRPQRDDSRRRPPAEPGLRDRPSELRDVGVVHQPRSEEHTSELQSQFHLVCRLLLEKKQFTAGTITIARPHGLN